MNERRIKTSHANIQVEVEGRVVPLSLDWDNWRWHSSDEQEEADFPLVSVMDGKRYELYSNGTFAEVEK